MALLSFRTRNPQRDRATDLGRRDRLLQLLHQLHAEIEAERSGLQARYETAQTSAAFALEAFENGEGEALSAKADDLSTQMQRYQARIAALEGQAAFMRHAEMDAKAFFDAAENLDPMESDQNKNFGSNNVASTADD
ncbi:hypothetical protein [Nitratireductor sp. GCM10026969]|uniref:hypothetical protein n=1 Tax=Nitratireductor sp. GCM10026969 TaxID=3252645 RepID=UPI0036160898